MMRYIAEIMQYNYVYMICNLSGLSQVELQIAHYREIWTKEGIDISVTRCSIAKGNSIRNVCYAYDEC